jgi:hypothetical protein
MENGCSIKKEDGIFLCFAVKRTENIIIGR